MGFLFGALGLALAVLVTGVTFTRIYAARVAALYPPKGRFLTVDGVRIHYIDEGPGTGSPGGTVVLLHGASSNATESMLGLGKALADRYRVVAFDRPGLGWSARSKPDDMWTPARQAQVLAQALRQLKIEKAVVVGHSLSGSVVPHFALDHTDVAGAILILSGVTHPWPGGRVAWYNHMAASWAGSLLTRSLATPLGLMLFRAALAQTFAPQAVPPGFVEKAQIPLVFRPASFQANGVDIAGLYEAVRQQSSRYPEIRIPVTVIGGDADEVVWTDLHSRSFAHDVPHARLIVLPGIGHMPQYSRSDLIVAEIGALAVQIAAPAGAAS
ncbi:alpha/beta fold hydrolase [Microvirga rosea]|uniref:alpha/beta fold hydrolase n=1 Tax=Microvirga rosea TaxID=2715425 RepID=UPI001D0A80BC|nr:alpha/beta hydrolase [Microvirga rosea]MCB8822402.1 alpha/beta hydrolase [Microvirga rosea]